MLFSSCRIIAIILIFLLIVAVCLLICMRGVDRVGVFANVSGGFAGESADAKDIYDRLTEYVDEVGTSKHIEDYLMTIHDMKSAPLDYETENNTRVKHKKLYQVIKDITRKTEYENTNDFLFCNGIKYKWFLPADLRAALTNSVNGVGVSSRADASTGYFTDYAIKTNLEKHLFPHDISSAELNKIVDKIAPLSRMYVKFRPEVAKRLMKVSGGCDECGCTGGGYHCDCGCTGGAKKARAKVQKNKGAVGYVRDISIDSADLAPDVMGFDAILWQIATKIKARLSVDFAKQNVDKVNSTSKKYSSVSEQLADINLISLQYKDPVAVYNFIKRIKPVIKHIEDEYATSGFAGRFPISSIATDLLAEQRDIMRAKWEKERAEKEKYKLKHELDIMRGKLARDFDKPAESWYDYVPAVPPPTPSAPPVSSSAPIPPVSYPPPAPPPFSPEYLAESSPWDTSPPEKPHLAISDSAIPPGLWDGGRMRGLEYMGGSRTHMNNRTNIKKKLH